METLWDNWPWMLIPIVVTVLGGLIATTFTLGRRVRSSVQHFTAGVVVAAIAGEVIPDVIERDAPWATVVGFVLGVALMFGISSASERLEARADEAGGSSGKGFPSGLVAAVAIDGLIDGFVIGIGFTIGSTLGTLVTVALSLEMFFLGLAAAATLKARGSSPRLALLVTVAAALMIAIGAVVGVAFLGGLSSAGLAGVLAFGCAALLFLVTEELLVEAHDGPETRAMSSLFFAGFLMLLVVEMVLST